MTNAAVAATARIKGSVLISRLNLLRQQGGPELVEKVLSRLSAPDQAALRGMLLPIGWYPLELNNRLDTAIAEALSPEDRKRAYMQMGRASADENLKGAHHVFLRPGDPHFLLSQAPQIYRFYYAVGSRTYERTSDRSAVLRTFNAETVTEPDCLTVMGWHERAVELSGGKAVQVTHPTCRAKGGALCEYHLSWE